MNKYRAIPSQYFLRKFTKLTKNNTLLKHKIAEAVSKLAKKPFSPSLKTHKVKGYYSSRVSGDIRIIWDFNKEKLRIIDLLDIGGHSGKRKVY